MCDADASDLFGIRKRDSLERVISGGARPSKDGDLEAVFARVNPGLHDTALGRRSAEENPLALELGKQKLERSVVEGRIAGLEEKPVLRSRGERGNDIGALAGLDCPPNETWRIAIPASERVVHEDHRRASTPSLGERSLHLAEPTAKACEQGSTVIVGKRVDHVNRDKYIAHPASHLPATNTGQAQAK
jgi:hypothetical protein